MNEKLLNDAKLYAEKLFENNSDGHDYMHTLRVYKNAMIINEKEKGNEEIVILASLLHDVDDYKLFKE